MLSVIKIKKTKVTKRTPKNTTIVMLEVSISKIAKADLKRAHTIISKSQAKTTKTGVKYFKY